MAFIEELGLALIFPEWTKVKPAVFSRFVGYMQAYLQDVFLKILVFEPKNRNMYH